MQRFLKKHFSSIAVSIIITIIFLYLLEPILQYISVLVVNISKLISTTYIDKIFAQISHLEIMNAFMLIVIILFSFAIAASSGIFYGLWYISQNKKDLEEIENNNLSTNKKIVIVLFNIIALAFLFIFISTKAYELSLISSFKQHIKIIAPFITKQKEEELISKWSLMKSEEDYKSLYKEIDNIADNNQIKLPENKIYSLTSI